MKKIKYGFMVLSLLLIHVFSGAAIHPAHGCLGTINAYAAAEESGSNRAYLYFYTVDGEEIDELTKKVSKKKKYEFFNPDIYKYLPIDDDDHIVYPDLYDQVNGIYWEEKDEDGNAVRKYKEGDIFEWSAGNHYFYVKTDNPVLTGENIMDLDFDEQAHLFFCNVDGDEIYSLGMDISSKDEYTFPDPEDYAYLFESGENEEGVYVESDEYSGKGTHWYCKDDRDKEYLFEKDQKCKFKAGEYYFYAVTDDPVNVTFYYPIDYETYYVEEDQTGAVYASMESKAGETIRLKKSLGAILWESTFKGWEEVNHGSDEIYSGGESYRIMGNGDLDFFAVYEYDEDWDPGAVDENNGSDHTEEKEDEELIVDIDKINEAAGAGYGAYVDADGKLQNAGGKIPINSSLKINGIPGKIKKQKSLSPLKPGVDASDPESYNDANNYSKDKYGRDMEDSNLEAEMNNVLRQDDSAMYMDVYGNSFVYYNQLSRDANMDLALERLKNGKTESWVKNVENWDAEVINRFEAIEFALLKGTYPADGEELVPGVVWKKSYMSEKAYKRLSSYKKLWHGWLDSYDDGLLEKYEEQTGSGGGITVGKSGFKNPFCLTAYAESSSEKNGMGYANQTGSRLNTTLDIGDVKFKPQYYDPSKIYGFSSYSFSSLSNELNGEQIGVLKEIFETLVDYGFSQEAAAGACGNIWQECTFDPKIDGGIVQWINGRRSKLKDFAGSGDWKDLSVQLGFMKKELDESYLNTINSFLNRIAGKETMSSTKNINAACDAWCAGMEGCTCYNSKGELNAGHDTKHNSTCGLILNTSYQHLEKRRGYAQKVYNAMVVQSGAVGGDFSGMSNTEILQQLFPNLQGGSKMLGTYYSESKMSAMMTSIPIAGTGKSIRIHQCIADDVEAAFKEIYQIGFKVEQVSGYEYRGIARNGKNLSVKDHASFHASGLAVDINWRHSPQFPGKPDIETVRKDYKPATDPLAVNVAVYQIMKSHGLLWGRDFNTWYDLMHFSVGEVSKDGKNAWISNGTEGRQ